MPRRVSLPAADELFRTTGGSAVQSSAPQQGPPGQGGQVNGESAPSAPSPAQAHTPKVPAPASEPEPDAGHSEYAATDEAEGEAAPGAGGEHAGRERRAATAEQPAPPQQRDQSGQERTSQRGSAKGRQATAASSSAAPSRRGGRAANRRPSGRERHDEKITVYVSAEELMDLEHARLVLRGEHGLAVDRGRIVREAVAVVLADLESRGDASILVRRLRGR